jgi:glycosyltransferase involved in cell wall biosynthesis
LRRAAREAVERADAVTAVSGFIAGRVRELFEREVHVIWNGADERRFYPRDRGAARERLQLPADRPVIAFAGNLVRAKGVYDLLDAAGELAGVHPCIVFAGAGPEESGLRARAAEGKIDARFAGRMEPAQIGDLFAAADAVTLPSYNEGLPNVVCEAMLSGAAVVATRAGGIPEIVSDTQTGLLVPPGDSHALASALARVLESTQLRDTLGNAAREFAREHLTWRISAQGYDRVYRQVLGAS